MVDTACAHNELQAKDEAKTKKHPHDARPLGCLDPITLGNFLWVIPYGSWSSDSVLEARERHQCDATTVDITIFTP